MATVTATFESGRTLRWEDGEVTGDPLLLRTLPHMAGLVERAQAMPEGPMEDLSEFESNPRAFAAAVQVVRPWDRPRLDLDGVTLAAPPPEDAN